MCEKNKRMGETTKILKKTLTKIDHKKTTKTNKTKTKKLEEEKKTYSHKKT